MLGKVYARMGRFYAAPRVLGVISVIEKTKSLPHRGVRPTDHDEQATEQQVVVCDQVAKENRAGGAGGGCAHGLSVSPPPRRRKSLDRPRQPHAPCAWFLGTPQGSLHEWEVRDVHDR